MSNDIGSRAMKGGTTGVGAGAATASGGAAGEVVGRAVSSNSATAGATQGTEIAGGYAVSHPEFAALGAVLMLGLFLVVVVKQE